MDRGMRFFGFSLMIVLAFHSCLKEDEKKRPTIELKTQYEADLEKAYKSLTTNLEEVDGEFTKAASCTASEENQSILLSALRFIFFEFYSREPQREEVQTWWQALLNGASFQGVLNGILNGRELENLIEKESSKQLAQQSSTQTFKPIYGWLPQKDNFLNQKRSDFNQLIELYSRHPELVAKVFTFSSAERKIFLSLKPKCQKVIYFMSFLKKLK